MIYTLVLALEIFHTTVSINSTEYYSAQAEPIKCDCCSLRVLLREFDCHLTRQSKIIVSITKKGALVVVSLGEGGCRIKYTAVTCLLYPAQEG